MKFVTRLIPLLFILGVQQVKTIRAQDDDPFADPRDGLALPLAGRDRIEAPVDEEAVLGLVKPFLPLPPICLGVGGLAGLRPGLGGRQSRGRKNDSQDGRGDKAIHGVLFLGREEG